MATGMVNIQFKVDSKGAVKEIKALGKTIKTSEKEATKWGKAGFFASAGASAYKLSVNLLRKALTSLIGPIKDSVFEMGVLGDRIAKDARMIGVTAEQFQVMEFAAKRSGTSVTAVNNGMKKLGRVMVDARNGSRQIKDTFNALGIELMKSNGTLRDTFDVFLDLADKSAILGESAERTGVQMLLLGRSGTELSNMLSQGRDGVLDLEADLKRLGAIMGGDALDNSELFVDRMADLEHAFRGVKIRIGAELMPMVTDLAAELATFLAKLDVAKVRTFAESLLEAARGGHEFAQLLGLLPSLTDSTEAALLRTAGSAEELALKIESGGLSIKEMAAVMNQLGDTTQVTFEQINSQTFLPLELAVELIMRLLRDAIGPIRVFEKAYKRLSSLMGGPGVELGLTKAMRDFAEDSVSYVGGMRQSMDATETFSEALDDLKERLAGGYDARGAALDPIIDAEERLREARRGGVSNEDQQMLEAWVRATQQQVDAEAEYLKIQKDRVMADEERKRRQEELLKVIEEQREATKQAIANLAASREKTDEDTDATKRNAAAKKLLLEQEKALSDWYARRAEIDDKYYEEFVKIDPAKVSERFMQGLIDEESFRQTMAEAAFQQLTVENERKTTALELWYGQDERRYEKYLKRKAELEVEYAEGRVAAEAHVEQVVLASQNQQMSSMQDIIGATGNMFGALSDIAMDAYRKGDQEALSHARALFAVQQAMALAGATVSTAQAITNALATPPAPLGIALAVGAGVAGAAQIATIIGTSIQGIGDAGLTSDTLRKAGLNNHSAIAVRNDETILDPVGTRHITEMLEIQKAQMVGSSSEQKISTTVEIDGRVLGESVDSYMIRQQERGLAYSNRVRQDYL